MTDKKDINELSNLSVQSMEPEGSETSIDNFEHRRRILKGAAVATPLMMTVASRPVLGAQCTPSAWVSGNLSNPNNNRECGGRSPGFWRTHPDRWACTGRYKPGNCKDPSRLGTCKEYASNGTKFVDAFGINVFGDKTLMQILWLEGYSDAYKLGAHLTAALFNSICVTDYGMSDAYVIKMGQDLFSSGQFCTNRGTTCISKQEAVLFIQNTFSY